MERNIIDDLSVLTTIDNKSLNKIFNKLPWCICDLIDKANKSGDNEVVADLGFGKLFILIDNNQIKYKFKPSDELEESIIKTLEEEYNPLTSNIEKSLVYHITHLYKDMF